MMACVFCDLDAALEGHGETDSLLVGEWTFDERDELMHKVRGRINLWYDFPLGEWTLLVLIDDKRSGATLPAVAMFNPTVCPMCGRRLK